MKNLVEKTENGVLVTDSLKLAGLFGREHNSVMRTIRGIIKDFDDNQVQLCNLAQLKYKNSRGTMRPMYVFGEELALIITGRLTGKDALVAQLKLANEFIAMRDYIKTLSQSDSEMLRISRISPNTLKSIMSTRSNNEVRAALARYGTLHFKPEFHAIRGEISKSLATENHDLFMD